MRTREPSAVSDVLSVMRLSRRAPPPAEARAPDDARTAAASCADALLEESAVVNVRARAESATADSICFFMAALRLRGSPRPLVQFTGFDAVGLDEPARGGAWGSFDTRFLRAPC